MLKLATIAPLDFAAVEASCRKTGRVLVVEETSNHGCVADELFARLLQSGVTGRFCKQNLGDGFIRHGAMQDLYALAGLNAQALRDKIREAGKGAGDDYGGRGLCERAESGQVRYGS